MTPEETEMIPKDSETTPKDSKIAPKEPEIAPMDTGMANEEQESASPGPCPPKMEPPAGRNAPTLVPNHRRRPSRPPCNPVENPVHPHRNTRSVWAAALALLLGTATLPARGLAATPEGVQITMSQVVALPADAATDREAAPIDIDVASENGGVSIAHDHRATGATIVARARLADDDRAKRFNFRAELDADGTLRVEPLWPDGKRLGNESCAFAVVVPAVGGVAVRTSNGGITLAHARGNARLATSNGAIVVEGVQGDLHARSSNGGITVRHSRGALDLQTSNGPVSITQASQGSDPAAGTWRVQTSNGAITLEAAGAIAGRLSATTSNGRATVQRIGADGQRETIASDRTVGLSLGGAQATIDLRTSNGSITVVTGG